MGNSFCQCNNYYFNRNIISSDISVKENKQKNNINNLLKIEEKIPENNTNINTNNNNEYNKIQESNEIMSKINKYSKDNINSDKYSKDNFENLKDDSNNIIIINKCEKNEEEEENEESEEKQENNSKDIRIIELNNVFDNLMNQYAMNISDEEFEKAINPNIIEIEKKLKIITKENNKIKELINDKILDKPALKFNDNNYI